MCSPHRAGSSLPPGLRHIRAPLRPPSPAWELGALRGAIVILSLELHHSGASENGEAQRVGHHAGRRGGNVPGIDCRPVYRLGTRQPSGIPSGIPV